MNEWEQGRSLPRGVLIVQIAVALHTSTDEVIANLSKKELDIEDGEIRALVDRLQSQVDEVDQAFRKRMGEMRRQLARIERLAK